MKLKIRTTAGAALGVAAMAAALSIGCGTLLNLGLPRILIVTGSVFTVMYLTARFCFNLFVRYRIKPIYQVLLSKNVKTHELPPAGDLVEEIQDELNLWAEKNAQEIARLKENERYRKEFLGNVSHEIKTPIFTVQGYILTLLDGGLEDKNINRKYLERSEKSIDRLINIVQDLEEISKLESGMLVLDQERFDIVALVHEIADAVEMEATAHRITVKVGSGVSQPPVYVFADPEKNRSGRNQPADQFDQIRPRRRLHHDQFHRHVRPGNDRSGRQRGRYCGREHSARFRALFPRR